MTFGDLKKLMAKKEHEHLEFKSWTTSASVLGVRSEPRDSLLGYCVALGNEGGGHLIVGVTDKMPRRIVGTKAFENPAKVKEQIYSKLGKRIEIDEILDEKGFRVLIIEIPPRSKAETFRYHGIPLMRVGQRLVEMDDHQMRRILTENKPDWSAELCQKAEISDLSSLAIRIGRDNYIKKNPQLREEVLKWDTKTFLSKLRLLREGKLTRSAIILLGKAETSYHLSPSVAQITWVLKDKDGVEKDYLHFGPPFLIHVNLVFKQIRNLKYRYMRDDDVLFPEEISTYDARVIREALNNCIAHQDYSLGGKIVVVESEDDFLFFSNKGGFIPGNVEKLITSDSPPLEYQNPLLASAMVQINMIDTIGSGIKRMFRIQRERLFPLPEYTITKSSVDVKIFGKVMDINYANILAKIPTLTLSEIMMLDNVQKKKRISKSAARILRRKGLIEGRQPNIYLSGNVTAKVGGKADYIKTKGLDDKYYKDLILEMIGKCDGASKRDITELLHGKLPESLSVKQQESKVKNLIYALSKSKNIVNKGTQRKPEWHLKKNV